MPVAQTPPTPLQLQTSAAPLTLKSLSEKQQIALRVYAKAVILQAANGTAYVGALDTLVKQAMISTAGMSDADVKAAMTAIYTDQATSDNSTQMPAAISDKLAQIRLFSTRDIPTLLRAELLLEYFIIKITGG